MCEYLFEGNDPDLQPPTTYNLRSAAIDPEVVMPRNEPQPELSLKWLTEDEI